MAGNTTCHHAAKKNEIKHPFKEEEGEGEKNYNENEKYETPKESKETAERRTLLSVSSETKRRLP